MKTQFDSWLFKADPRLCLHDYRPVEPKPFPRNAQQTIVMLRERCGMHPVQMEAIWSQAQLAAGQRGRDADYTARLCAVAYALAIG